MIKEVTMYTVICDRCGKDASEDGGSCWGSPEDAVEVACEDLLLLGTYMAIEGKHYCGDCVMWNDDESELIPKPPVA
jgi:hypothetical protein